MRIVERNGFLGGSRSCERRCVPEYRYELRRGDEVIATGI
jgi:hypothetical protein